MTFTAFVSFTRLNSVEQTSNQRITTQITKFPATINYVRHSLLIDLNHKFTITIIIIIATKIPLLGQLFIFLSYV